MVTVVVMMAEEAEGVKNWGEKKVEVVEVAVAEPVVQAGYVTARTEMMGSTFVQLVQAGKEVVVVDMQTRVGEGVDMMQIVVVVDVEAHNHSVESSDWNSPSSENTDFLLVEAEGQVLEVEEKCDWAARVVAVADQNLIEEEVVEGMPCTTPCPL